ncbi:MAG: sulfatase-like hydrolase/transferase, partial [Gemmataceae bacterium]|nr:sulfatase-like hydrolase/transferase [Gemmataceae bacterium]
LCYGAIHSPYMPAERHQGAYAHVKVPIPADIYPPRPGKPAYMQTVETWSKGKDGQPVLKPGNAAGKDRTLQECVRQYQQCAIALDEGVGKVLAALEESGQLKNTLVVFTSDQGFAIGQHGFHHKLAPYDANLRAPFIISMPGTLPEGKVCQTPVGGADLVPTFFRFAGLEQPWEMHGHDLTPLLQNPDAAWPHPVLIAFTGDRYGSDTVTIPPRGERYHGIPWYLLLRQERYKYIRTLEEGEIEELYDVRADPEELTNLAQDPKYTDRLKQLREATLAELRRTGAGLAKNLPAVAATAR